MKNSFVIAILITVVAIIAVMSMLYIIILPHIVPEGLSDVPAYGRRIKGGNEPVTFQVLKVAHNLPRYHPLHQALSQDFAAPLEFSSNLKLIVELYAEGALGDEDQILKGTTRGTIEICLVSNRHSGLEAAVGADLVPLTLIPGPTRHVWRIRSNPAADRSPIVLSAMGGLGEQKRRELESRGLTPQTVDQDLLERRVRDGRAGFIVLDLLEWYYQDWNQWTVAPYIYDFDRPTYMLLANAGVMDALDAESRKLVERLAEAMGKKARSMVEAGEEEIIDLSGFSE